MSDDIRKIVEDLTERTEKFGCYVRHVHIYAAPTQEQDEEEVEEAMRELPDSDELKKQLVSGDLSVIILTTMSLNELAFSDRVQDPEKVRDEDEFKIIAPTEFDLLRERMARNIEAGRDPLAED